MPTAKERREQRAAAKAATTQLNEAAIVHPDQVAAAGGPVAKPQSGGAKVIVACKLGVAYFDIQLCKMEKKIEQTLGGGREKTEAVRVGKVVRLRGTAYPRGTVPDGFPDRPEMVGGAALNYGVDKEFFDDWMVQNKLNPLVLNKMVFAHESVEKVRGEAKELAEFASGLEPINPKKDYRTPKSTRAEVEDVQTEAERAKKMARAG